MVNSKFHSGAICMLCFIAALTLISLEGCDSSAQQPSSSTQVTPSDTMTKTPDADQPLSAPHSSEDWDSLKSRIIEHGDTIAYLRLRSEYTHMPPDGFLFWALVMANKYEYLPAYCDVYFAILDGHACSGHDLSPVDPKTREFALDYLRTADRKGSAEARSILQQVSP